MYILVIFLLGGATFGLCYLFDKGLTGVFRGKPQHKTGLSVRLSQHYGGAGLVLTVLGLAALFKGLEDSKMLLFCGVFVILMGLGLVVYYMSFGVYYDKESFILTTFGKKSTTYSFGDIQGQRLYRVTGGSVMVELLLKDGRSVGLQSNMKGIYPFLDAAFAGWCRQKGLTAEECTFHDPRNSCWFPNIEE